MPSPLAEGLGWISSSTEAELCMFMLLHKQLHRTYTGALPAYKRPWNSQSIRIVWIAGTFVPPFVLQEHSPLLSLQQTCRKIWGPSMNRWAIAKQISQANSYIASRTAGISVPLMVVQWWTKSSAFYFQFHGNCCHNSSVNICQHSEL